MKFLITVLSTALFLVQISQSAFADNKHNVTTEKENIDRPTIKFPDSF